MRTLRVLALFVLALVVGASATAVVAWVIGGFFEPVPERVRAMLGLGAVAVFASRDLGIISFPLPQRAAQIPQEVLFANPGRASIQFGFEFGSGLRTFVTTSMPYLLLFSLWMTQVSVVQYLAAAVGFGVGRSFLTVYRLFGPRDPELFAGVVARAAVVLKAVSIVCGGVLAAALVTDLVF